MSLRAIAISFIETAEETPVAHVQDGMVVEWDVEIVMDDGLALRADVYRPVGSDAVPVILSHGPYGKWLHFADGQPFQWERMSNDHPDTVRNSSNAYQSWELVDPEKWVPDGYAVVRVDSRGAGRSPGVMDLLSPRETEDLYACIEWAGAQPWSNGKVGMNGISYYAINAWQVAALQPPHLAAICMWEGASDLYREQAFHGGLWNGFNDAWYPNRIVPRQHGQGNRGLRSRLNGELVSGPRTLSDEELAANRTDFPGKMRAHPFMDEFWESMSPDLTNVTVPLLSAGNWGGVGLHLRGNVEGFLAAKSTDKWLEMHGLEHWTHFYTDYGVALQKQFFGHFLRGEDTGWTERPPVLLQVRHADGTFEERAEQAWPLERTRWTTYALDLPSLTLQPAQESLPEPAESTLAYEAFGDGVTFLSAPLETETELTGPIAVRLHISSDTDDADLFVVVRAFGPDLREVTFQGSNAPHGPVALGWLRASHRALDEQASKPYRPVHTHRSQELLVPGEIYPVDVEVWPTSVVLPKGYRLAVSVRGNDYVWPGASGPGVAVQGLGATAGTTFTGVGPFRHNNSVNRPAHRYGGTVTLHAGPDMLPHILLPVIGR
ncbi:CocE/NonD family hydrolase [Micromonospora sp. NPDC005113]